MIAMEFASDYNTLFQTVLTILSAIITGGFVLVFVEIGNRKNRENDKYEIELMPFMRKLSAYLRFMSWCSHHLKYPQDLDGHEKQFKKLVDKISGYGGHLIVSGGDIGIDCYSAEYLEELASDINNIWYWHDKMNPCRIKWDNMMDDTEEFIMKELSVLNPLFLSHNLDVNMVAKVSGDFYTDVYQPIQYLPFNHESRKEHYGRQTGFVLFSSVLVLSIMTAVLFYKLPMLVLQISTTVVIGLLLSSLLILGIDINKQIRLHYKIENYLFDNFKKFGNIMNKWKDGTIITFWCTLVICAVIGALWFAHQKFGLVGIVIVFIAAVCPLQIFKIIYEYYSVKAEYNQKLVNSITRCWICYNILNSVILTGLLYMYLFVAAETQWLGFSTNIYFVIILIVSCIISLLSITSFNRKNKEGKNSPTSIIYAYAPRFVIMLAFVVFYCIKYINEITQSELIPALFLVYIGVDRIYTMMIGIRGLAQDSYKSIYEDTEKWIKKQRKME